MTRDSILSRSEGSQSKFGRSTCSQSNFSRPKPNSAGNPRWEQSQRRHANVRALILQMLSEHGKLSSREIAERTGWALHTFSGRLNELEAEGAIRGTGERRCGAEVFEAVPKLEQLWRLSWQHGTDCAGSASYCGKTL